MKISTCLLRKLTNKDCGKNAFISGALAGVLSMLMISKQSRAIIALYLISRAGDTIYLSLINKKIIKKYWFDYLVLFAICMIMTGYAYSTEPGLLDDGVMRFYNNMTNQDI